ncbi:uncharacterized protein LOC121867576 isoform X2 [Homarus americanus]|uniref:uncharacterized protein LOC121867576 isoform X2 n=1 Tax=Homarus americanus TaxID=6706 RepID=UPI001C49203A|nr:uncharacterized protein LOC121867576 isoform X2 [Homarus americanus]
MNRHLKLSRAALCVWATMLTVIQVWVTTSGNTSTLLSSPASSSPADPSSPHPPCPRHCIHQRLHHPLAWWDKRLLHHLQAKMETPPKLSPQHLNGLDPHHPPWEHLFSYNQTEGLLRTIFQGKAGGVFVEVGAQDGLWLSNSWWLEAVRGWQGLLVEADPLNYLQLRASPRTSRILPVCVTADTHIVQEQMVRTRNPSHVTEELFRIQTGHSKRLKYATPTVDLLILDVSGGGFEMMTKFLTENKDIGNHFHVKMILYQDNELLQFFSLDEVKENLQEHGYRLIHIKQNHYLLYHESTKIHIMPYNSEPQPSQ